MTFKDLRTEAGMTQAELAEKAGVHVMQISKLERGVAHIQKYNFSSAMAIADALGIEPHVLLKCE